MNVMIFAVMAGAIICYSINKNRRLSKYRVMNIGIIGSGGMGGCLASKFVKLGHTVSIANSRGPASLKQFLRVLEPRQSL